MDLASLQKQAHAIATEKGWRDEERYCERAADRLSRAGA